MSSSPMDHLRRGDHPARGDPTLERVRCQIPSRWRPPPDASAPGGLIPSPRTLYTPVSSRSREEGFMILGIVVTGLALLVIGYFVYGRFVESRLGVDPGRSTPAHTQRDGIDHVPARPAILLGHHFSSIAGAGPIVGPIIAAAAFGWLPAVVWVVLGAILIGGVQDFSSLIASLRHKARSVADMAREEISPVARILFLLFVWFTLVYVIVVFTDLTAATFTSDPGVASSSLIYIVLAVSLGLLVYRAGFGLGKASFVFVPLVFLAIWGGQQIPLEIGGGDPKSTWSFLLLGYCFVASVLPVWFLLQPRDYLSSFLLYVCLIGGILGVLLGGGRIAEGTEPLPALLSFHDANLGLLFPAMFITIACGAASGFHSIVASGTTAKQLSSERHARPVAYGSMLLESVLALLAISAVILIGPTAAKGQAPTVVFGHAIGRFFGVFGIPQDLGAHFGALAISTFLLTTLDTCTRLARYTIEELARIKKRTLSTVVPATLATLILPLVMTQATLRLPNGSPAPAWQVVWPVFGATNQLLGALAMLAVTVWLRNTGRSWTYVAVPMAFMFSVTLVALAQLVWRYGLSTLVGIISGALFLLAVVLLFEAVRQVIHGRSRVHAART
ncbi:MAG: carbon starvation protein A [Candidatus Eisenbacteria bacterium]|nr:carbon starvation protein A [Candidatus Latescibacterota bacterium]MBD3301390.1 carbon starvation protein A [Candidatus Eisenbacteria bacterium]